MTSSGVPFSNAARNLRQIRSAWASWCCVAVILGIQMWVGVAGGHNRQPALGWFELLGLSRDGVLTGRIWQIFTYGFLHGGWWHAGLNSLFVLVIGSRIEHMTGPVSFLKAVVLGVIGGGICHVLLGPGGTGTPLLVGISGGCMALLLLLTTLSPQSRMMPLPVSGKSLGLGIMSAELILALVDPALDLPGFSPVGKYLTGQGMGSWFAVGHACHFGGGAAGWLLGTWLMRPRITLERLRRDRARREAIESNRVE
jgi:membrane associated rhomboid family serine protease